MTVNRPGPGPGDPARPGPPLGGQRRRLPLTGTHGQVTRGRHFTSQALRDWNRAGQDDRADDVLLIVSELLANACLHADGPHELVLTASAAGLRVEVHDGEAALPRPRRSHQPGTPGGHGLHIVQLLADRWGATLHPHGKAVWAEIASVPPRPPAATARGTCRESARAPLGRLGLPALPDRWFTRTAAARPSPSGRQRRVGPG